MTAWRLHWELKESGQYLVICCLLRCFACLIYLCLFYCIIVEIYLCHLFIMSLAHIHVHLHNISSEPELCPSQDSHNEEAKIHSFISYFGQKHMQYCHNGFPLDLDDHKNKNRVVTDLFCTGVIGHLGHMFLNQGQKSLI